MALCSVLNWHYAGEVPPPGAYVGRLLDRPLIAAFKELPALMIVGPRAAGKTTTAGHLVPNIVRLNRPAEAAAFRADPDAALAAQEEPVVLDPFLRASAEAVPLSGLASKLADQAMRLRRALDDAAAQVPLEQNPYAERELDLFVTQLQARVDAYWSEVAETTGPWRW